MATNFGAHQLYKAADVDVLCDLRTRPELRDRAAVRAVADLRVLYMHVRTDAAFLADHGLAFDHREGLDDCVLADADVRFDEGGGRIDDGHAAEHQPVEDALPHHCRCGGETDAVFDAHRLVGVVQ